MSRSEVVAVVRHWIRVAEESLDAAEALLRDESFVPRQACWLAQQVAEKSLTALLTATQTPFPLRDNLDSLRDRLPEASIVRREHPDLAELTGWTVDGGRPADWQMATVDDAHRAVRRARAVFESAVSELFEYGIGS